MALPKSNRLSLRFNKDRLLKTGINYYGDFFTFVIAKQEILSIPHFAILVSKKTARLATDRNLIRRRTSTLLTNNINHFSPLDILVLPKNRVCDTKFEDLQKDISNIITKINK